MKNFYIIFLYLTLINAGSLNKNLLSGKVTYIFEKNKLSQQIKIEGNEVFKKLEEQSYNLELSLVFNSEESLFFLEEKTQLDNNSTILSFVKNIVTNGKYYFNLKDDILLREANNYDNYTLVSSKPSLVNWKLINESKKIGNYTCLKAITTKTKTNNSGSYEFIVEAWYTPEIPVHFGPLEFNNLPGLILELKDTHYTFKAKEISLNKTNIKIEKPISEHIISEEEYVKN